MVDLNLALKSKKWSVLTSIEGCTLYLRGKIWQEVGDVSKDNVAELGDRLSRLNGFFALVFQSSNRLVAAVDHIRSIPLFYGQKNGRFYLSDDAEWVRQKIGDNEMDSLAKEEFQLAGYVTGRDTLFPNLKQLQAGEFLVAEEGSDGVKITCHRYYRFLHTKIEKYEESVLYDALDKAAVASVQRLIDYADCRQIVVPLSGGYDSRLIVTLLKRLDYTNVFTFTYGVPGNKEAEYGRIIAESLGFEWSFIEYSDEEWFSEWKTESAETFRNMASNHTSLPHIQDWLAVKKLIKYAKIDTDSVVAPGHCCVTGFIPKKITNAHIDFVEVLYEEIIKAHFSGRPLSFNKYLTYEVLVKRINSLLVDFLDSDIDSLVSKIMYFNWSERQSKYIANSVRVYEQYGLDWWLPLWDKSFVSFWENVPLSLRLERVFFKDYVAEMYSRLCQNNISLKIHHKNASDRNPIYKLIKRILLNVLSGKQLENIKAKKRSVEYNNHHLGFNGLLEREDLANYTHNGYTLIGSYSDQYLKGTWGSGSFRSI